MLNLFDRRRRRNERGVVAVALAIIACFVLIPVAALAVDIGVQRVARTDMQSLADVVALDLARQLDGERTGLEWGSANPSLQELADQSRDRNTSTAGAAPEVVPELGTLSPDGEWQPLTDLNEVPGAVRVTASTSVSFGFMPGEGATSRSATAVAASTACYKLGSYAAAIRSGDSSILSLLNDILGVNLTLVGYQGLGNVAVSLTDLASTARIGSPEELLTSQVSYVHLLEAIVEVLQRDATAPNQAAVALLQQLISASVGTPAINTLGDLLSISPTDTAALGTQLNVLDLVVGSLLIANGEHAVEIPNLWANVAGTGSTKVSDLAIIQGASTACGRAGSPESEADSAQLSGSVVFEQMNSPSINLPGLANFKTKPAVGVLKVELAGAHGRLANVPVQCGDGTAANPHRFTVDVSTSLSRVGLDVKLPISGEITVDLNLIGISLAKATIALDLVFNVHVGQDGSGTARPVELQIPPNDTVPVSSVTDSPLDPASVTVTVDETASVAKVTAGVAGLATGTVLDLNSPLLTGAINGLTDAVLNGPQSFVGKTITPLVDNINTMLTGPLKRLLGLELGGADVYGINAVCNQPILRG